MKKLKFNHLLALASTIGMIAGSHSVYAQTSTDAEEIIVTGFKASLEKSTELKKASDAIVEAISAEDIGKLPDKSIAESLMRLPGLATQRVNGRSQVISIRGFSPEFGTTLLNGRQQAATNDNRAVQYDQYPAEFTSAAVVYKTPDATLLGQGIAGTVDIRTVRPLAYGKQAIVANVRYEQNAQDSLNSDVSNKGNKETFSYIDQFADNTIGVSFGLSHTDSPTQGEKFNAWGYPTISVEGKDTYVIGGVKPFVQSDTLKRDSVMGTLEYKPSESFSTSLDVFYSEFKEEQLLRGIELPLQWSSAQLQPDFTVTDGVVTSGTFKNVQGVIRNDATLTDATVYALGWNTKFEMGDSWSGDLDISKSSADRNDQVVENYSGYIGGADTLSFETTSTGTKFHSSLDYSDASKIRITNLQSWGGSFVPSSEGGQKGYYSRPKTTDELSQIRFSASRDLEWGAIEKVTVGVAHDVRDKTADSSEQYYFALPNHASQAPLPSKTGLTDLSFLGFGSIISYDPLAALNSGLYNPVLAVRADIVNANWSVNEKVNTAFVKFNIKGEFAEMPVTGNVGVQVVSTDQSSDGNSASGEGNAILSTPQHGGATYSNVLPSANLSFELTEKDFVKVGAARTLTRVGMGAMRASSTFSLSSDASQLAETTDIKHSPWSAGGGNPELKPWIADSIDLSVEHYFDDNLGYWSAAGFYKELKTYVYNKQTVMDFTGFPIPTGLPDTPHMFTGFNNIPTNGKGGIVRGLEFTLSLTGEMLSDYLNGFGAVFTSSYTDSNITPPDSSSNKLPGLSNQVRGLQFYYEKNGFSARISQNYRSAFLGDFTSNIGAAEQRIIAATTLVDAQIGYTFESGVLEGLGLSLQANNLNDEPTVSNQQGNELRTIDYQLYGRSYALNINYKF